MCRAGCFGPLTRLAHRAVAEADDTEPAVVATAMYDAWVNSGGTARALIEKGDMHLCDQFERDAMWYMNLCMHHTDCARAILADLELVQTHTNYPKVMRALLEISTRDDIFVKSECTVMMSWCGYGVGARSSGTHKERRCFTKPSSNDSLQKIW